MNRASTSLLILLLAGAGAACGTRGAQYRETVAAADAHARKREPEEAARLYQKAARETSRKELAVEAEYREAWAWKKAGDMERALACLEALAARSPASTRAPRIWLDIGRLHEASGDLQQANVAYRKVLDYPESGLAPRAADALVRGTAGSASSAYSALLQAAKGSPRLASFLQLRIAQAEAADGRLKSAIERCEIIAKTDPLPTGVYTDDALLLAARLRRTLGDSAGAVVTIDALLAAQEKSALVGSYERPTFAEARWLLADIREHDLGDPAGAESVLHDLARLNQTSRLADDAQFRAAWLARTARKDEPAACSRAGQLARLEPASSLAECLGEVCPSRYPRPETRSRRCERAVTMAQGSPRIAASEDAASEDVTTTTSASTSAEHAGPSLTGSD